MATYLELRAQAEELMKEAERVRQQELVEVIADIKKKMADYNITAADLGLTGKQPTRRSSGPQTIRYRGPNGEAWSGMGRQPEWLKRALEQGKSKEDFAV